MIELKEDLIVLSNDFLEVQLLPMGATIYKVYMPDKNGKKENVVLSHRDIGDYDKVRNYYGCVCGRHAGRIVDGNFSIDGKEYHVTINDNGHSLHGGNDGISFYNWDYKLVGDDSVEFSLLSRDGHEGYPANVNLKATYTLKDKTLSLHIEGTSDAKTLLNITNHSFFNMSGAIEPIYNQELLVNADKFIVTDECVNAVSVESVDNTEFDFRTGRKIGDITKLIHPNIKLHSGYDTCFIFENGKEGIVSLYDEKSGRKLSVTSTYPSAVLFSANNTEKFMLDNGESIVHGGLAIEHQYVPNAINRDDFEQPITSPENPYDETINYTFELI